MILRILFLFVFIIIIQIDAATNVSGVLIQNTVWTADASENPYILMRDVQIPFNSTLTIQPGVIVDFSNGDFEILVKGFLRVEGTSEKPIIFQGGFAWHTKWMVKFQSTQLSLSSISNARFIGPKKALQLVDVPEGIQENNGTLLIQSSIFSDNTVIGANGNYPRSSSPSVPVLQFQSCIFNITTILSANIDSEPITIDHCEIYDTKFYPRASNEGIEINNCNLTNIIFSYGQQSSTNLIQLYNSNATGLSIEPTYYSVGYQFIVRMSTIQDFGLVHLSFYGSVSHSTNATFEDSTLSNVWLRSIYSYDYAASSPYTLIIRNCIYNTGDIDFSNIMSNIFIWIQSSQLRSVNILQKISSSVSAYATDRKLVIRNSTLVDGGIAFELGPSEISYSTITLVSTPLSVQGNSFITCTSISRSSSIPMQNTVGINATALTLSHSTIKNFAIGIQTYPIYTDKINITDTNFIRNSLYNIENKAIYDVYAQNVYWGTNNSVAIAHKINDYWDDIEYGLVISSDSVSNMLNAEASCPPYEEASEGEITSTPVM